MREDPIHSQLGHVQIVRPGFYEKGIADPYAFLLPERSAELQSIEQMPGFKALAPRLAFFGLISHGDTTIAFVSEGVDPEREKPISTSINIVSGDDLATANDKAVLLGEGLAASMGVKVGDTIVLLMVLLSVANSVNMTLFERTREFGTLLALGDRPGSVFRSIVTESVLLGIFGALTGMLLGCVAAWLISAIGIPMSPPPNTNLGYTAYIRLVPLEVLSDGGIGLVATCLAAVLSARRASRMPVADALARVPECWCRLAGVQRPRPWRAERTRDLFMYLNRGFQPWPV